MQIKKLAMNKEKFEEVKAEHMKANVYGKLANIEKHLNGFLNGELCLVDFLFYETMLWCVRVEDKLLDNYPKINAFMAKFEALDGVNQMMQTDSYKSMTFYPPAYVADGFKNTL